MGGTPKGLRNPFSGVPPRVRRLIYVTAFVLVGVGYSTVFITAWLPETPLGPGAAGIILGAEGLAMVVAAIPLGILSDRIERKKVLLPAAIVYPSTLLVFALTQDLVVLVLAAALVGIATGAFLSTWNALIADQTTTETRNAAFSLSFIITTIVMGVGLALPVAFPPLEAATGWDTATVHNGAMAATALVAFIAPAGLWGLLRDYVQPARERVRLRGIRGLAPLLRFSALNGLIGLGAGFIIPLIATWMFLKYDVPDDQSGPLLALASLTIGVAAVSSSTLAKRFGQVPAVCLVQGTSTVLMFSLTVMPNALAAGIVYVVRAALMNMAAPLMDSFLMGIVPRDQRGVASAVNTLTWRLPNSITTVIGGLILAGGNYELPIYLATLFYAASITGFYVVFRDVKPRE